MSDEIFFYLGRANNSDFGKYALERHSSIVNLSSTKNICLISALRKNCSQEKYFATKFKRVINVADLYDISKDEKLRWDYCYPYIDNLIKNEGIKRLVFFDSPFSEQLRRNVNIKKFEEDFQKSLVDPTYILGKKVCIVNKFYKKIFFLKYIAEQHKEVSLTHLISDPLELDYGCKKFFFYPNSDMNAEYYPYIEYVHVFSNTQTLVPIMKNANGKSIDFVFGLTGWLKTAEVRTKFLENIHQFSDMLDKNYLSYRLFYKTKDTDQLVPSEDYNNKYIADSQFTLILPSYDETKFSTIRFFESIYRLCIPLIYDNNNLTEAFSHYPAFAEFIKSNNLVIKNIDEVPDRIKSLNYSSLKNQLVGLDDFRKLLKRGYYDEYERTHSIFN